MALPLLPLTYDEMRARFRLAVHRAGLSIEVHPIYQLISGAFARHVRVVGYRSSERCYGESACPSGQSCDR